VAEPLVIRCRENGPLVIQGAIKLVDHLGNEYPIPAGKDVVALCRCGGSHTKPFCDGSHRSCGFQGGPLAPVKS
jgi:CDGSH-type Zn-finger protein